MSILLQVLVVEDSADDAEFLLRELKRGGYDPQFERVDTVAGLVAALEERKWDIVLSDYRLPQFDGRESLRLVRARLPDVPFILISGAIGEETAVAAMKAGANDYLNKQHLARLVPVIERELREAEMRRQRHQAAADLAAWQRELESRVMERTAALSLAHQELRDEMEQRQRLEAQIARAGEREQLRLGQELHDGLGQQLTGIGYLLAALHDKLVKVAPAQAREAQKIQMLIFESIEQTRNLSSGFYPVELERDGLLAALRELINQPGLPAGVSFVIESGEDSAATTLKGPSAIQLFRIAQEAVRNALQHAHPKQIVIQLATVNEHLILVIKDDGVGFPANVAALNGIGLTIMSHRMRTMGGTLDLANGQDDGAVVTCSVPLQACADFESQLES